MKIAIIGTGIAGNVLAHRLHPQHEITVFEANAYVGGHSNTVQLETADGPVHLDTGFMVFNDRTYPNFLGLMDQLDIAYRPSEMSFSVQCQQSGLEYNGSSLNGLFAQRSNLFRPAFYGMIRDILRFNREALESLDNNETDESLAVFLARGRYGSLFIQQYLIPMGAAIWSAEPDMMERMPARFFIRFFNNHGLLSLENRPQWKVIQGGSQAYVSRLVADHLHRIRLSSPVQTVIRHPDQVLIKTAGSEPEAFDRVFIACHSDQALTMLDTPTELERQVLDAIPYQSNEVILHQDDAMMPSRRAAWASWNYHIPAGTHGRASLTYHLNRLHSLPGKQQFFVTLNSGHRIRPETIIQKYDYSHPVFNRDSVAAQARQDELNGLNRTYYCGAYWRNGFHEDGVVSALAALESFEQGLNRA
ncbi:MAG: FAD-dependent oxidoreductase [Gammaproteobacteria bacterium]|nr:FAD-dependent oxidoreductase [Gammaproteobacteria bacterium]